MHNPSFDALGNPIPPMLQAMAFSEFEQSHVTEHPTSLTRAQIFSRYQHYLRDFRTAIGVSFSQWVDGSFTTSKLDPQDIDVINFVPFEAASDQQIVELAKFKKSGGSREEYQVDAHIVQVYPADDRRFQFTQLYMNQWAADFGFDKNSGQPKTVVALLFSWFLCVHLQRLPARFRN